VGGIETIAAQMAENLTKLGHDCTVVTQSTLELGQTDNYPYPIVRSPNRATKIKLIKDCDIVYSNGASVQLFWWAKWLGKPFVWTHQGYQLSCIDGLGWVEGEAAPFGPFPSFVYHAKRFGIVTAFLGVVKLMLRRLAGKWVDQNVAVTTWVAYRQPLPHQIVLHTPYRVQKFAVLSSLRSDFEYDFVFVGRLVSEKGVETLLNAFQLLLQRNSDYDGKLLLIGDGTWRTLMETKCRELQIETRVRFAGKKTGEELLTWVGKGKIAVIPSEWEEPMGGVSLEMMAAGKPIIVSRRGGLAECVGKAGLVFENGDRKDLADTMEQLLKDQALQETLRNEAKEQLKKLDEVVLTQNYVDLFEQIIKKRER